MRSGFWYANWAFEQPINNPGMKFVLVALATFSDGDGYCFPGQQSISRLTGQDVRTVRRHIATLVEKGFIRSEERRRENGSRTSNGYWLNPEKPVQGGEPEMSHSTLGQNDRGGEGILSGPEPTNNNQEEAKASSTGEKPRELKPLFKAISSSESVPSERSAPRRKTLAAPKRRGNLWVDFIGGATEAWNSHKQRGWVAAGDLTGRELKDLAEFWKHYKKDLEAASNAFVSAVKWAAQKESWADGKSLTLAEMLANSKLILYSQKAIQNRSDAQQAGSLVMGGVMVQAGDTMAYRGSYNVKILSVEGTMAHVETEAGAQHTAYADELGAPL